MARNRWKEKDKGKDADKDKDKDSEEAEAADKDEQTPEKPAAGEKPAKDVAGEKPSKDAAAKPPAKGAAAKPAREYKETGREPSIMIDVTRLFTSDVFELSARQTPERQRHGLQPFLHRAHFAVSGEYRSGSDA